MKRESIWLVVNCFVVVAMLLMSCGPPAETEKTTADAVVTFTDPNLETAIREAINKPVGPIYTLDLEGLTSLSALRRNISDLAGLEYCIDLNEL